MQPSLQWKGNNYYIFRLCVCSLSYPRCKAHAPYYIVPGLPGCIVRLKRDGTRAETRFRLSPKRTSPFKSAGASVKSTAGSRGVRISVSSAGYATFRGSVRVLATHSIRQFPFTSPPVRHRVPSGFKRTLQYFSIYHAPRDFRDKKGLNTKCVFFLQHLSEIFLILRRTERDIIINIYRSSCNVNIIRVRI